eukprot:TRINITY_DN12791_c0_g1_i2.p1 TRINITY_DN12791_c0_g1~~TRINITY_DN12791_c0_g1_i2.p1  ORF type:complete len:359 (+),score=65.84 TRINITY_DN12791_c0_g1_i2:170-1246(+)
MGGTGSALLPSHCKFDQDELPGALCSERPTTSATRPLQQDIYQAVAHRDIKRLDRILQTTPLATISKEMEFPGHLQSKLTPLALALNYRDPDIICRLLDCGISANTPLTDQHLKIYTQRAAQAAQKAEDDGIRQIVPATHFEALCSLSHKDLFQLLLSKGGYATGAMSLTALHGDADMVKALLEAKGATDIWQHETTPLVTAIRSRVEPYEKVKTLFEAKANPDFIGGALKLRRPFHHALSVATKRRDRKMTSVLLKAGADVNQIIHLENLPTPLFWAAHWGEKDMVRIILAESKFQVDLSIKKPGTDEDIFAVVQAAKAFSMVDKPKHIAKLPLPKVPSATYDEVLELLEEYRNKYI